MAGREILLAFKEPVQFIRRSRAKRCREFLPDGREVRIASLPEMTGNQQSNAPTRKGTQQLGVPLQERPEVNRAGAPDEVREDVSAAIRINPNGHLVGEVSNRGVAGLPEYEMWHLLALQTRWAKEDPLRRDPILLSPARATRYRTREPTKWKSRRAEMLRRAAG